jgi:uncharacterized protein (DUF1810 family)
MDDPCNLKRFVSAQEAAFERACAELRAGRKRSHWMWFVFPQIAGLGRSETARFFAISGAREARAYFAHSILGPRLREACRLANAVEGRTAHDIFGDPDDVKFHSCLTLFAAIAPDEPAFSEGLRKYFRGEPDPATLRLLEAGDARTLQPK